MLSLIGFCGLCGFVFFTHIPPFYSFPALYPYNPVEKCVIIALIGSFFELISNSGRFRLLAKELVILTSVVLICAIMIPFSMDVEHSKFVFTEYLAKSFAIFWIIVVLVNSETRLKVLLFFFTIGALYLGYHLIVTFESGWRYWGRAYGKFVGFATDPNDIALVMVYTMPMTLGLFFSIKGNLKKTILFCSIWVMYLALIRTYSRGGFLGFVTVGVVLFFSFYKISSRNKKLAIVFTACVAFLVCYRYMPMNYIWRMQEIVNTSADTTGSATIRAHDMGKGWDYMLSHPISKVGIGNSGLILRDLSDNPERYKTKLKVTGDEFVVDTQYSAIHSLLIQPCVELGAIPTLILVYFMVYLVIKLKKTKILLSQREGGTDTPRQKLLICLKSSFFGFFVAGMFLPIWYRFYLYFVCATCFAFIHLVEENHQKRSYKKAAD